MQADLSKLVDAHFSNVRLRSHTILTEQREKLSRSLSTDLNAALRSARLEENVISALRENVRGAGEKRPRGREEAPHQEG